MHEIEGEMEANEEEPEMPLAELVAKHSAGHLRIPVVERGEDHEEDGADQHVVEVGDNEVRVASCQSKGDDGKHDAGEAGDEELKQEPDGKLHRCREVNVAAPQRGQPVEDFDSGGHGDRHRRKGEEGIWRRVPCLR